MSEAVLDIVEEPVVTPWSQLVQLGLSPDEADARFDAVCTWYFGRDLADHARVRRRIVGLLLTGPCKPAIWPWGTVREHCGVSDAFLTLVLDGLLLGTKAAFAKHATLQRERSALTFDPGEDKLDAVPTAGVCFLCGNAPGQVGDWPRCPNCGGTAKPPSKEKA